MGHSIARGREILTYSCAGLRVLPMVGHGCVLHLSILGAAVLRSSSGLKARPLGSAESLVV